MCLVIKAVAALVVDVQMDIACSFKTSLISAMPDISSPASSSLGSYTSTLSSSISESDRVLY